MSADRALRWEAWAISLDDPDWAARVTNELDFLTPTSARDLLLQLLSRGPQLHGLWLDLREALRKDLSPAAVERLLEQGRDYLLPDADFATHYLRVRESSRHFRSRGAYLAVDESLLRSPQPRLSGLIHLKETYGLNRVINLREESQESRDLCSQAGLDYRWIPVEDMQTPQPEQVRQFLASAQEGVNLVHCFAGQGRTGLFVTAYRVSKGLPLEEAIEVSDAEIFSRGMREGQREWLRQHWSDQLSPT